MLNFGIDTSQMKKGEGPMLLPGQHQVKNDYANHGEPIDAAACFIL